MRYNRLMAKESTQIKDKQLNQKKRKRYTAEELAKAIEKNKFIYNDYFRIDFIERINSEIFQILDAIYFRSVYIGFDELPRRNNPKHPVILVSNHSGMAFPWDAIVFGLGLYKRHGYDKEKKLRVMISPSLSRTPIMHPYLMREAWKMAGGVDATYLNFETMMHYPEGNLLIYPEGIPGIGKGFNRKYQLQRFATSFVRMSLKYRTDIVSYSTVNAEYVAPFSYSLPRVNKIFSKMGIPLFPIGPLTVFLCFPFAFYLSLPAKMHFVRGRRLKPYQWLDKPFEELTEEEIRMLVDRIETEMQEDLNKAVKKYGKHPYRLGEFLKNMFKHIHQFPLTTPLGWMFLFHEYERQWWNGGKDGKPVKLHKLGVFSSLWYAIRNPITLAYFLPILGWIILIIYGNWKWKRHAKWRKKQTTQQHEIP